MLESKEESIFEYQKMIKTLQDKNFESQIELIEIKKQLTEALRAIDNETNLGKGEG